MISVTVDMVVCSRGFSVLLVRRKNDPFAGHWALPGGFLNEGEAPLGGAIRELEEETGFVLTDEERTTIFQIGAFGAPDRDPRGHVISIAYFVSAYGHHPDVQGADDATEAAWVAIPVLAEMPLAFDHRKIIEQALLRIEDSFDGPHLVG